MGYLLGLLSTWLLTVAAIMALAPLEKLWPRLVHNRREPGRLNTIVAISFISLATALFYQHFLQTAFIGFLLPLQVISIAKWPVPDWLVVVLSILVLDFLYYLSHVLGHRIPLLWRFHAIHHSDRHVTAASGLLHHPLEFVPVVVIVMFFTIVLGLPVIIFIAYGFAAAAHNAFSHSEVSLPRWLDQSLRWLIVTPDMHRTHHSIEMAEGNSNFGAIFSIWDWIFRTYTHKPNAGESELEMGLPPSEGPRRFSTFELLWHPFRKRPYRALSRDT